MENDDIMYIFNYEYDMVNINNEKINYLEEKKLFASGTIISYSELLENLDQFLSAGGTLRWSVNVTDGIDTVFANEEQTIFVIGKYAALSVVKSTIPDEYNLSQNYPNPFNPSTRIQYSIPNSDLVQINIYTLAGQKVSTLVNRKMEAGNYIITWSGMDDKGNPVSAGVYLYQFRSGQYIKTRKMIYLK